MHLSISSIKPRPSIWTRPRSWCWRLMTSSECGKGLWITSRWESARSRCQRRLRRRSSSARWLGLRVRVLQGAWMSVSRECCMFVRYRSLRRADPSFRGSPTECGVSNCLWSRNLYSEAALVQVGPLRHKKKCSWVSAVVVVVHFKFLSHYLPGMNKWKC
jgi:hypothetical protein